MNLLNITWICPKINSRHSFHDSVVDTVQKVVGGFAYLAQPDGIGLQVKLEVDNLSHETQLTTKIDRLTRELR